MSETIETLGQLLGVGSTGIGDVQLRVLDSAEAMKRTKSALRLVPSKALADLSNAVGDVLDGVLKLRVSDVLSAGWNTGQSLLKYTNQDEYPPGAVIDHPLGNHTISSTFHPAVEILVNRVPVPDANLEFTMTVALSIDSAVLRIRDAHLIGASVGKCHGNAALTLAEARLLEGESREFSLPVIRFEKPVPIR